MSALPQPDGGAPVAVADGAPALEVVELSKTFPGGRALDGVSFALERGQVHALIGGNGSGKSTLVKCLAGIQPADPGGEVVVGGERVAGDAISPQWARAHGLRFVHQDPGMFPTLTVRENFALGHGYPSAVGRIRWSELSRAGAGPAGPLPDRGPPGPAPRRPAAGRPGDDRHRPRDAGSLRGPRRRRLDPHPRRADGVAAGGRGRAAARGDPPVRQGRARHRVHQPPPRRGDDDLRHGDGAARRQARRRRAPPRACASTTSSSSSSARRSRSWCATRRSRRPATSSPRCRGSPPARCATSACPCARARCSASPACSARAGRRSCGPCSAASRSRRAGSRSRAARPPSAAPRTPWTAASPSSRRIAPTRRSRA